MTKALFGMEGKRVIILGGGFGMGEATANLLADLGCNVAVLDIVPARAERVAADVAKKGVRSMPLVCDVLDDAALVAAMTRAERDFGPLDGLVTIVGMAYMGGAVDMPMETFDLEIRRNVRYIFLAARELARNLITRGAPGAIVSVASVDGLRASTGHAAYGSAKAALVHLAKSLAGEWSPHGIRFNVVAPGSVVTPRLPVKDPEKEKEQMKLVPMPYRGGCDDVANALVFLLSNMSKYITGHTLPVDGGLTAVGPIDYRRFVHFKGEINRPKT
jgi:NAD(P)-dependent dehydrogenase (short-subunit alcohol dehydrogenase family)